MPVMFAVTALVHPTSMAAGHQLLRTRVPAWWGHHSVDQEGVTFCFCHSIGNNRRCIHGHWNSEQTSVYVLEGLWCDMTILKRDGMDQWPVDFNISLFIHMHSFAKLTGKTNRQEQTVWNKGSSRHPGLIFLGSVVKCLGNFFPSFLDNAAL